MDDAPYVLEIFASRKRVLGASGSWSGQGFLELTNMYYVGGVRYCN